MIDIAKSMIQSCYLKRNKVYSESRYVVAFFLRRSVEKNKPGKAIVGKAVEILQIMASSPLSANIVGKQCTSIILPSDPNLTPKAQYHSNKVTAKVSGPSFVDAERSIIIDSPEFEFRDSNDRPVVVTVPKVGRNSLCPCGSGKNINGMTSNLFGMMNLTTFFAWDFLRRGRKRIPEIPVMKAVFLILIVQKLGMFEATLKI
jgi:hypothetical protein